MSGLEADVFGDEDSELQGCAPPAPPPAPSAPASSPVDGSHTHGPLLPRRMSTDAILSKARMIQTEINVYKQEIAQLNYKVKDQQDKIKDNKEKIKLNKQLPYLCAHVVEVRVDI